MHKIIEPELSYQLTGLCFKTHKKLGRFAREKQYCDDLEEQLKQSGLIYAREFEIKKLNSTSPAGNKVDFLVENKVIIDCKAKAFITKADYLQMQRYLQAASIKLGLIVNFRSYYLKPKRIINIKYDHAFV